jgi:hypothetical protein
MSAIQNRYFIILITLLISYGVIVRLAPLRSEESMLQSISEDGYLMMTVARNIALGLGMTTSNGTIPTNGVQPLSTFLWSGVYWLVAGDKVQGVLGIILIQFVIATLAAVLLWQIGIRVLSSNPAKYYIVALAVAMWYANPLVTLNHTKNGLETGLYVLAVLGIVLLVITLTRKWSLRDTVLMGFLLGITFWIRNDAAFLILAVCLTQLFLGSWQRQELWQRFFQVNVMGTTTVLIALPWLIYNKVNFGAIMPISGQAESLISFGEGLPLLPSVLIEYFFMFPLPSEIQKKLPIIFVCIILLIVIAIKLWQLYSRLQSPIERRLFVIVSLYLLGLSSFYSSYFGVPFFLARYLFPISPFFALLWAVTVFWIWLRIPWRAIRYGISILFIVAMIIATVYRPIKDKRISHFQMVTWVKQHVNEEEWIASIQTGYLGYFHDRTINLDGKVNPEALKALQKALQQGKTYRQREAELVNYIVNNRIDSQQIEYIINWVHANRRLNEYPIIKQNFKVVVDDYQRNLGVLKRQ